MMKKVGFGFKYVLQGQDVSLALSHEVRYSVLESDAETKEHPVYEAE